jgi:Zn-dependent peptidase ImmA (M78 family)
MARRRSSIYVLGHKMRIKRKPRLFSEEGAELCGYCDFEKREIWISMNEKVDQNATLLHEVLHAILHYSGQGSVMEMKDEETLVTALEHGLQPLLGILAVFD